MTFGVIGGTGATGKVVMSELRKYGAGEVLVGGRGTVDVLDARSLDEFCRRCSIVINCAGPVMALRDRAAQAAFRNRRHYIDLAGLSFVKEGMLPYDREMSDLGLSCVVSAGWAPGLTELLPVYAYVKARAQMDAIESLRVYFADSGDWSDNALRDGVWHLRRSGMPKPGYYRKGEWVRASMSSTSCKVDLGGAIGLRRFSLFCLPELEEVGRGWKRCDLYAYSYLSGPRTAVAAMVIAVLPLWETTAVGLLRGIFRRNRLPVAGMVVVQVHGFSQGRRAVFDSRVVFGEGHEYRTNGVVPALVARWISEGKSVRPGVHFLADAVDPILFVEELRKAGVEQSETLTSE